MFLWNGYLLNRNIRHFTKNLTNTVEAAFWSFNSAITREFDEFGNNTNILARSNSFHSLDILLAAESFINCWDIFWEVLNNILKKTRLAIKLLFSIRSFGNASTTAFLL